MYIRSWYRLTHFWVDGEKHATLCILISDEWFYSCVVDHLKRKYIRNNDPSLQFKNAAGKIVGDLDGKTTTKWEKAIVILEMKQLYEF